MLSNHFILWHPLVLLTSIFSQHQGFFLSQFFSSDGQIIRVSASASVLPINIQDWFPLGWTGVFSKTSSKASILWCSVFWADAQSFSPTFTSIYDYLKTIALTRWTFVGKVMSLLFICWLARAFSPRSKCLLILWLQSPSAMILKPKKINLSVSIVSASICQEVIELDAMILAFCVLSFKQTFFSV